MMAMSPADFAAAIAALGWSQAEAARQLGVTGRAVRMWIAGDRTIPGPVKVALRCISALHHQTNELSGKRPSV